MKKSTPRSTNKSASNTKKHRKVNDALEPTKARKFTKRVQTEESKDQKEHPH
jgi:hypothetical protein